MKLLTAVSFVWLIESPRLAQSSLNRSVSLQQCGESEMSRSRDKNVKGHFCKVKKIFIHLQITPNIPILATTTKTPTPFGLFLKPHNYQNQGLSQAKITKLPLLFFTFTAWLHEQAIIDTKRAGNRSQ